MVDLKWVSIGLVIAGCLGAPPVDCASFSVERTDTSAGVAELDERAVRSDRPALAALFDEATTGGFAYEEDPDESYGHWDYVAPKAPSHIASWENVTLEFWLTVC